MQPLKKVQSLIETSLIGRNDYFFRIGFGETGPAKKVSRTCASDTRGQLSFIWEDYFERNGKEISLTSDVKIPHYTYSRERCLAVLPDDSRWKVKGLNSSDGTF